MKNLLLTWGLTVIALVFSINNYAQVDPDEQWCGTGNTESSTVILNPYTPTLSSNSMSTFIIPVVVHIIHNGGEENISDAQVHSAIDKINMQYRGEEGGTDSGIEFRLAKLDPEGNCTTGIVRIQHPTPNVYMIDNIDFESSVALYQEDLKDLSRWDPYSYLNIWIVKGISVAESDNIGSYNSTFGFAGGFPEVATPELDGVVIKYKNFGTIEASSPINVNLIRNTESHEIGHYLFLLHPFDNQYYGPQECNLAGDADCTEYGDRVCDTHPASTTIGSNYPNCDNYPIGCTNPNFTYDDYVYPADNYMSYVVSCHIRFTPDQINRMHETLTGYNNRTSLWNPTNLMETGVSDNLFNQSLISDNVSITPNGCDGQTSNGAIDITVSGGSGNYTYLWSNGDTSQDLVGVEGGWYTVQVFDSGAACSTESYLVPSPTLSFETTATCTGQLNGAIDLTVIGATGDSFVWETNWGTQIGTEEDISNITASTYHVDVVTTEGCEISGSVIVPHLSSPFINNPEENVTIINTTCENPYGSIYVNALVAASGVIDDLIFTWTNENNEVVGNEQDLINVPAGIYTLEIHNPYSGCSTEIDLTILPDPDFPISNPTILTVNNSMTITDDLQFLVGIEILNGATLTIDGASLRFGPQAGITVREGGTLITNNNTTLAPFTCEDSWLGIEVLGTPGVYQGVNPNNTFSAFGLAKLLNGTKIVQAEIGITNAGRTDIIGNPLHGGGKINTNGANFTNCKEAVRLMKFVNLSPGGTSQEVHCNFKNTSFRWVSGYPFSDYSAMVRLFGVKHIDFLGCEFTNETEELFMGANNDHHKAAIYMVNSSIDMNSDEQSSTMTGFNYGIVNFSKTASSIRNTQFRNYRSIYQYKNKVTRITKNQFLSMSANLETIAGIENALDPIWQTHYGIYMEFSTAFWIEANAFFFSDSNIDQVGVIIRASGETYNQIYGNNFVNCKFAVVAYDDNQSSVEFNGLKLLCNNFTQNDLDVWVDYISVPQSGWGISSNQGTGAVSAGNQFDPGSQLKLDNFLDHVDYFKFDDENIDQVNVDGDVTVLPADDFNDCPTTITRSREENRTEALIFKSEAETKRLQLDNLVDGGDTDALTMEVVLADYADASELYYELMSKSPSLSTKVMLEAIEKEYTLPSALLTMILKSNPTAAKSSSIQSKLDDRMIPLSEYQRYMIDLGKQLISEKEYLEAQLSYNELKFESLMNQSINLILFDDTIEDKEAEIAGFIEGFENIDHHYAKIDRALERGDIVMAQSILANIPSAFALRERQDQEWMDYNVCYQILINLELNSTTTLTNTEIEDLELIAIKHSNSAAGLANQMLEIYGGAYILEGMTPPGGHDKAMPRKGKKEAFVIDQQAIKVYPNPAKDYLVIELMGYEGELALQLIDAKGQQIIVKQIQSKSMQEVINLKEISSGVYQLLIFEGEKQLFTQKVVIN